ncbi:MAG: hypothetical protein HY652_13165 [Acidobacteria bacterium]|nr:hypothetical protein [Acidobacteriota bacterium]
MRTEFLEGGAVKHYRTLTVCLPEDVWRKIVELTRDPVEWIKAQIDQKISRESEKKEARLETAGVK